MPSALFRGLTRRFLKCSEGPPVEAEPDQPVTDDADGALLDEVGVAQARQLLLQVPGVLFRQLLPAFVEGVCAGADKGD